MFNLYAFWAMLRQSMHALRHGLRGHRHNEVVYTYYGIPVHYVAIGCTCGKEFFIAKRITRDDQLLLDSCRSLRNNPNRRRNG